MGGMGIRGRKRSSKIQKPLTKKERRERRKRRKDKKAYREGDWTYYPI